MRLGRVEGEWVHLDEDALPRAIVGCVDDVALVPLGNPCQAARSARIVPWNSGLHHICDAVFELQEDILTVIDTEPVSRTKILVNPYPHRTQRTEPQGSRDIRS